MSVKYLFIDMNSYFASVEQQLNPALRGRPVVVAPVDSDSTCCISASRETKKFGIKTGTRISDARRLCPGLVVISVKSHAYIDMHHKIVDAVASVLPVSAVLSVDEMVCRLWGDHATVTTGTAVAKAVKRAIFEQAGEWMSCSVGLAPNRLLAKVASDMQKPDGLTVIRKEDLPGRLHGLALRDFPGVGPRMERRLNNAGIATVEQFTGLREKDLARVWGSKLLGGMWFHRLRGEDVPDSPTRTRSLGHSKVLSPAERNHRAARAILVRLTHKAAARLRHVGYYAGSVSVSVSYEEKTRWGDGHRIPACRDTLTLLRYITDIWEDRATGTPKKVGLVLGDLVQEANVTKSLFDTDERLEELSKAMDEANTLFGKYAVHFGGMFGLKDAVTTRIAFGAVPDRELADC